jgi:protein SCO1/2
VSPRDLDPVRRRLLGAAAAVAATGASRARAEPIRADHGRVTPPVPLPPIGLRCADGQASTLAALVQGRATALHLMFATCSTVCPIQGAIFERIQSLLPDQERRGILLLSISIDPTDDTPAAMREWLARFHARSGWVAAAPAATELDRLLEVFGQGRNAVENHATQVNIVDRSGQLVYRTPQLPSAESVADILCRV